MKKILLITVFGVLFTAFASIYAKKNDKTNVVLSPPPPPPPPPIPFEDDGVADWNEYNQTYNEDEKDAKIDASFEQLLKLFPMGSLPFSLSANELSEQVLDKVKSNNNTDEKRNVIPKDYRKFFPLLSSGSKFSRMPPPIGEPFKAFETGDKYVLIYFTRRGLKSYMVATFTKSGKLISEKHFAHARYNDIYEGKIDENLNLTCTSYEVVWDIEPGINGYENGSITGLKPMKKTVESLLKENSQKEIEIKKEVVQRANP